MDFFGIGSTELILILIVLLIVVPPSKLPEVAGTIGKGVRKFKEMTAELTKDFKGMADEVKDAGKEGNAAGPKDGFATILKDVKKEVGDVRKEINIALKPGGEVAKELKGLVGDVTGVKREVGKVVVEGGLPSINNTPDIKDETRGQDAACVLENNTEKKEDA